MRAGATVTQLIFDHALRVRVKADSGSEPRGSANTTTAPTPDNASAAEEAVSTSEAATVNEQDAAQAKKQADAPDKPAKAEEAKAGEGNFVGRLNNLVTSDVSKIIADPDIFGFSTYFEGHNLDVWW